MQTTITVSVIKKLISVYRRLISPLLGSRCRYVPSCSEYASEAVQQYGAARGTWLALKRLCRCHPWGGSGFDPLVAADCRHGPQKDQLVQSQQAQAAE